MLFLEGLMQYGFLQKALITSVTVGIVSGVIGSFIILRGMSLMGDAISHAVLPGVAISYMMGMNFFIGAATFGIAAALGIGFVNQKSRIKNDTAIGIVFSAFFALGIILISFAKSSTDLYHILFGNVLAVRSSDMWMTIIIAILVISLVAIFYKEFLVSSFDPVMAEAYGLNVRFLHYFLMLLLTLVTVSALQTVGIILVVAMLITPAATAYLLTNKLSKMIMLASTFGAVSAIIGLYFSYIFNLASGAAMVLVATIIFFIAFLFAPHVHPNMKYVMDVRKELGTPTIFNLIGPLTNPVHLETQLMGIYRRDLIRQTAEVLGQLGRKRAVVLNGAGFMDEASLAGENHYALYESGEVHLYTLKPEEVGLASYPLEAIRGGDAKENAAILRSVLDGEPGAYLDTVLLNAGFGLFANGKVKTVKEGVDLARDLVRSGLAKQKLQDLITYQKEVLAK